MSQADQSLSEVISSVVSIQRRAIVDGDLEGAIRDALGLLAQSTGSDLVILRQHQSSDMNDGCKHTVVGTTPSTNGSTLDTLPNGQFDHEGKLSELLIPLIHHCDATGSDSLPAHDEVVTSIEAQSFSLFAFPLKNAKGTLLGVLGFAGRWPAGMQQLPECCEALAELCIVLLESNVENRVQSFFSVLERQTEYRHLLESNEEACFLFGDDAKVLDVNNRACQSLGYTREELIGKCPSEFDDNVDPSEVRKIVELLDREGPLTIESAHRRKDGSTFPVIIHTRRVRLGQQYFSVALATDITDQKSSQRELHDSRMRLQLALDASRMGVWELDREKDRVYWSPECLHLLDVTSLGNSIDDFTRWLHPEDASVFLAAIDEITPYDFGGVHEYRILAEDSSTRWIECAFLAIPSEPNHTHRIVGTMRDVTQRKSDAQRLRDMEQEFSAIVEHSPVAIFVKDMEGRYTVANRVAREALGDPSAVVGRTDWELLDRESAEALRAHDRLVLAEDREHEFEDTVKRDGFSRTYLAVKFPLHDGQGKQRALCGIATDITERLQAERKLRLAQFSVDNAAITIFRIGRDATILYTNDWACESLGYSRDELVGMSLLDLTEHTEESWKQRFSTVMREKSICVESQLIRRDGTAFPIEVTIHYNDYEGSEFLFAFAQDISEKKENERRFEEQSAELLHASRLSMIGQMVATMSHEVAQPLSATGNFAAACSRILEKPDPEHAKLVEYVSAILKQNQRCGEILKRLRDFSKTTAFQQTGCDLAELLRESVSFLANELGRQEVPVFLDLSPELPSVHVDRVQIQQVVINLLTNARDALCDQPEDRRQILLKAWAEGSEVAFSVEDRGKGLSDEEIELLFDPFFTTKQEGMGLGLSICHTIIAKHGGRIEAASNQHGGATFTVRLPLTGRAEL